MIYYIHINICYNPVYPAACDHHQTHKRQTKETVGGYVTCGFRDFNVSHSLS